MNNRYPSSPPAKLLKRQLPISQKKYKGSATITMVKIEKTDLVTLNMGDSGYALFHVNTGRKKLELYFESPEKQKRFNFPYQVGTKGDQIDAAEIRHHKDIRDGDIVMVYSDGYSDNVFGYDMHHCFNLEGVMDWESGTLSNTSLAADCSARLAFVMGKTEGYESPF